MKHYIIIITLITLMSFFHFQHINAQYESGTSDDDYDLNPYEMNLLTK